MRFVATVLVAFVLAIAAATPALAQTGDQPCDTGREYAHEHIVVFAQEGLLGQAHKPGGHRGFVNVPDICF